MFGIKISENIMESTLQEMFCNQPFRKNFGIKFKTYFGINPSGNILELTLWKLSWNQPFNKYFWNQPLRKYS